jgi:hypothetical protein
MRALLFKEKTNIACHTNGVIMSMLATGANIGSKMTGARDIVPKGYRKGQLSQFTPEQMQLFQSLFGHVGPGSFLSRLAGGDQGNFNQLEAPALRQFGELQGGLASRFSGFGTGARNSSGFQNTMNQATSDFAQQLQSQRMGLQTQAIQDLIGLSGQLLGQRPSERFLTQKKMPFWQQFLGGTAAPALGQAGGLFGGLGLGKWAGLL